MKLALKELINTQVLDYDKPDIELEEEFAMHWEASIGELGNLGVDYFHFWVRVNPELDPREAPYFKDHHLIMQAYNYDDVVKSVTAVIESCHEDNWEAVGNYLHNFMCWEFHQG